eukprot:2734846-Ditylum_brightwellii.AAC.1
MREVIPAYFSIYLPSVSYVLSATTFTETELHKLQQILLPKLLPHAGFKYHFPYAVAFALKQFLGVGLHHLKAVHFASQVETFIKHYWAQTSVGNTAEIMVQWAQVFTGISTPVLEDKGRLPYLEGGWIPNLRDGLIAINAELRITRPWLVLLQRENDKHIMDSLRDGNHISDNQLEQLNRCRLYFHIDLLSDITTSDGNFLLPQIYTQHQGKRLTNQ